MNEPILEYQVFNGSVEVLLENILRAWQDNKQGVLACLNPHSYVVALDDTTYRKALHTANWLIPDGAGIVLASKFLRGQIHERLTGSDIFNGSLEMLAKTDRCSIFFLGSTEETLAALRARMAVEYPNIHIAGTLSPPFKPEFDPEDDERMIQAINEAAPDVLWVGMTAPKQEKWIFQNKDRLNVKFIGAIGAVFDFYAGNVKRAPIQFQRMGLEWLYRWIQEPRRLWRRNLISTPKFLLMVLKEKFKRKPESHFIGR